MPPLRSSVVTASLALFALGVVASPTVAGGGEVSKTPKAILVDMQRDLGKVKSYRVVATVREKNAVTKMSGDVFASGSADIVIGDRRGSVRMRQLPEASYIKADASYWKAAGGKNGDLLAKKLAGRWVKVPASVSADLKSVVTKLSPKYLASCATVEAGTVINNGIKTVAGRRAIELEIKGDRPGTSPGLTYVTADGPVLPVRTVQTGPRKPGGKVDERCEEREDHSTSGEITFSRFDAVPKLVAPRGALSLG
jgi:hypothetical protein